MSGDSSTLKTLSGSIAGAERGAGLGRGGLGQGLSFSLGFCA